MKGYITIAFLLTALLSAAQNVIQNSSFEDLAPGKTYYGGGQQNTEGAGNLWDNCDQWKVRQTDDPVSCNPNAGCCMSHSPDWTSYSQLRLYKYCWTPNPFPANSGDKCIFSGHGNAELVYQKIQLSHIPGKYYFNAFIRRDSSGAANLCPPYYLDTIVPLYLYLSNNELQFKDEDNCYPDPLSQPPTNFYTFKKDPKMEIALNYDIWGLYRNRRWTPVKASIDITEPLLINWIGLMTDKNGEYTGKSARDLFIDDVSLVKESCYCPIEEWIENTTYAKNGLTVAAERRIRAGYDIGAPSTNGNVVVQTGASLTYQAGNAVELLPGFVVEPGATFTAKIEGCLDVKKGTIKFAFPNAITPNGDGLNDQFSFPVLNATDYMVNIYDRWDAQIVSQSGIVQNNRVVVPFPSGHTCGLIYKAFVYLSNCDNKDTVAIALFEAQCAGTSAKRDLTQVELDNVDNHFSLLQNPIDNEAIIQADILNPGIFRFSIIDANGAVVKSENMWEIMDKGYHTQTIPVADLASGFYTICLTNKQSEKMYFLKMIKK